MYEHASHINCSVVEKDTVLYKNLPLLFYSHFFKYLFCFRTILETQHSSTRTGHKNAMVPGWSPDGSWSLWGTSMAWTPSRTPDVKSPPSAWLPDVTQSPSKLCWSWEPLPRFNEAETSGQQLPGERVGIWATVR